MLAAFSNDYYELIFRATQSVELFCTYATDYVKKKKSSDIKWLEMLESLGFKNVGLEESIRLFEAIRYFHK